MERDLVECPGRPGVLIERNELHQPTILRHTCSCGVVVSYPEVIDHRCDFTCCDPDDDPCDVCGRFYINGNRDTFVRDGGSVYCSDECNGNADAVPFHEAHPPRPR